MDKVVSVMLESFGPQSFLNIVDEMHPRTHVLLKLISALIALSVFLRCQCCDLRLKSNINIKKKF